MFISVSPVNSFIIIFVVIYYYEVNCGKPLFQSRHTFWDTISFPELVTADAAASQFLQHYAHPILAGIVFAGLFAAIMSTADAFLNTGTAAIMYDIPSALGKTVKNQFLWARVTTVLITVVAAIFALYTGDLVAILGGVWLGDFCRR